MPCEAEPVAAGTMDPRPGSRADRMAQPLTRDVLRALAEHHGVCVRPLTIRRIDRATGQVVGTIDVPCGARRAAKCRPCAERNRRLRQRQIRQGWHLSEEPVAAVRKPTREVVALLHLRGEFLFERDRCVGQERWEQVQDLDDGIAEVDELLAGARVRGSLPKPGQNRSRGRTVRSTRRRQDVAALPRRPVENISVGRVYRSKTGKTYQPSMLLTITLPSYGAVHTGTRMRRGQLAACGCGQRHAERDDQLGTPIDPERYDYRAQALALIFLPRLLDRFWQNYRRAAGWKIAYAGVVEMQRRLATHAHFAVRGTVARALTRQVAQATYHQVWWPAFHSAVYSVHRPPTWDEDRGSYVDPTTQCPLRTWAQALKDLDAEDAEPAHVARLGSVDVRGIEAGTPDAERAIRYVTKYLTKDLADQTLIRSPDQRMHHQRLFDELAVLPCSPRCANWLLYGVQPDEAVKGLVPGRCRGRVHQKATLGYTGRRCLLSRNWSNKTLTDHRLDGRDWLRAVTAGLLDQPIEGDDPTDRHRYAYELARSDDHDVVSLQDRIFRSITARLRARAALRAAAHPARGPGNLWRYWAADPGDHSGQRSV